MANAARVNRPNFNRPADINRRGINGSAFTNNRPFDTRPGFNRPEARFSNRQDLANRNFANRNFMNNNNRNFNRNFVNNNVDVRNRLALNQRFTRNNFNGGFGRNNFNGGFFNTGGFWNRPWFGGRPWWFWNRPWGWSHWGWFNGYWDWPWSVPNVWLGGAPVGSWLGLTGDTFAYDNPYYAAPPSTVDVPEALNYSSPIPVPTGDDAASAYPTAPSDDIAAEDSGDQVSSETSTQSEDPTVRAANELFDAAREAFKRGDYATAQADVEKAIEQLPSDAVLHEFRALTLFAQGQYSEAAAALYAVLAAGPGWDWATMSSLYPDVSVYAQQLRALEDYDRQHPTAGDARFLLAYHYLVLGYKDEAVKQLREVVRLTPNDKLSAALLKALTSATPAPSGTPRPAPLTAEPRP
jgi:Tetratricopeptide repeat